jgi:uncharacterized protein with NAD-binding domain and iron-sulfur cluster
LAKRQIAIVGGGMAALAAAFELTRTQTLRDRFAVTIYQMGWRLGGKAASGRDAKRNYRIVEHGLHVWFGCYENAFRLLNDAYNEWDKPDGQTICGVDAAFVPQTETIIGAGDASRGVKMRWPELGEPPWKGSPRLDFWDCIAQLQKLIHKLFVNVPTDNASVRKFLPDPFYDSGLFDASVLAKKFAEDPSARTERELRRYVASIRAIAAALVADGNFKDAIGGFRAHLVDVGTAIVKGVIFDIWLGGKTVLDLDRFEFREWLTRQGADRSSVYESFLVRALYDSMFQYIEGDPRQPNYGAGTAAQVVLRIYGGYRGAPLYELAAGIGEVVVAPFYGVLKQRGVEFCFFHKLTGIELTDDEKAVAALCFDQQVRLRDDVRVYLPTKPPGAETGGLEYWPNEPDWDQINPDDWTDCDLESYWCTQSVGECRLRQGREFDDVVLAIPVSAFKQLNAEDEGPCAELIAASESFRRMAQSASPVPTIGLQAWMTRTTELLGGVKQAQESTGPRPLNIWADRTDELTYEDWSSYGADGPKSLQLLCDVLDTDLFKRPASDSTTPGCASKHVEQKALEWFVDKSVAIWPYARGPSGAFDWEALFDPGGNTGPERLCAQGMKANVSPGDCCAGSPAGSTQWRLPADGSGFEHLFLAGAWIDSGFNTECIEAAVMSGKQAARAISGEEIDIPGEQFLSFPPDLISFLRNLIVNAGVLTEAVAEALSGGDEGGSEDRSVRRRGAPVE